MWGNKLGWGISGVLVVLMIGMLFLIDAASAISPPTTFSTTPERMGTVELPVDPATILPMSDPCDAGDLYKQAIADYEANSNKYDRFLNTRADVNEGVALKGVQLILQAAPCANMTLFTSQPEKVITYAQKSEIEALRNLGKVTSNLGLLLKAGGRQDDALKHHEAVFALGAKLYKERIAYAEFQLGLEMMSTAIGTDKSTGSMLGIAKATDDSGRVAELEDFRAKYLEYDQDRIRPVWRVISSIDQKVLETHVGDVFALADGSTEKMWRVEAILKLGRYKYNAGRSADQRGARRYVKRLVNDSDPAIKIAGQAAKELTIEQYRTLH